jgi:hypothetical protein
MNALASSHEELQNILPNDYHTTCHNFFKSCTVFGPKESIRMFVDDVACHMLTARVIKIKRRE